MKPFHHNKATQIIPERLKVGLARIILTTDPTFADWDYDPPDCSCQLEDSCSLEGIYSSHEPALSAEGGCTFFNAFGK